MKFKWLIKTTAIALLIAVAFLGLASHDSVVAAQDEGSKIETMLLDQFATNGSADYIVRFTEQADLSAAFTMDWDARGDFVYNTLRETAANSQVSAKAFLDNHGLAYQTFIGGNELYVWNGTLASANALAALPEVGFIRATRTYYIDPSVNPKAFESISWAGDYLANNAETTVGNGLDATTDWGILDSKADQFWEAFTVQGDGILVANIDTGVQWNHPALDQSFKCGSDPTDPICWDDPSNVCGPSGACDNNGHGTHTMGTMVADDDPSLTYIAGMAPNAQWIACKGCETNSCSDFALTSCADWILAPGGDAANRPDVVNNSWGGGGGDNWYETYVQAWVAAGIFPAFSAGNSTGCGSLGTPGDYQESFGTTGHNSSRIHAYAQGPSFFGDDPYTKPNITAPAVSICSSVPTNSWSCGYSGTSMASPHSAGAVALLWSCNPSLIGDVYGTFEALQNSADAPDPTNPVCGAPVDGEGTYEDGYGYLNVFNAGIQVCGGVALGTLEGHVLDTGENPIEGASVIATPGVEGNQIQAVTDPDGYYTMDLVVGTYDVTASKAGYQPETANGVVIEDGLTTTQDFTLTYLGSWTQIPLPAGCPDYTRYDAEYYPGDGLVYILGGRGGADGGSTFGDVYTYNPVTNTCTDTTANMPNPVSNYTINLVNDGVNDLLCIFGGRAASGASTLNVQCYNPNTNTASVVTNLPTAYTNFTPGAQVVVDNMVYVFGGFNPNGAPYELARTDRYDPVGNTFTQIGNLSLARSYLDAAVVDGKIYAFGGTVFDGANLNAQTRTEVMADPGGAGTWDNAAVAELPTATAEGRAYGFDTSSVYELAGKIVIASGGQWPSESVEAFTYDVASDTYDYSFPDLNTARRDGAGFFVPGNPGVMWVFGGRSGVDTPPYATPEYLEVALGVEAPNISVDPAFLDATLLPDDMVTVDLTISNVGNAPLDWSLSEVPGFMNVNVSPASNPTYAEPRQVTLAVDSQPASGNSTNAPKVPADAVSLVLDDGGNENNIGVNDGVNDYQFIWLNRFTPDPADFPFNLNQIQMFFDSSTNVVVGDDIDLVVYQDSDGNPANGATWLATYSVTVQSVDGVTWSVYDLPAPLLVNGPGDVLIAAINRYTVSGAPPLTYPAALDMTVSQHRSWVGWWNTDPPTPPVLPPDALWTNVDAYFPGNWLIRGTGETMVDVPWLSEDPTSGTVPAGESVVVEVTFDATGLTPGEYAASLAINSNDPDTPLVNVPVTLSVQSADLAITKTGDLDPVLVDQELTYTLLVTNSGPQDATDVIAVDTLPFGVNFVSASAGCSELSGVVTCVVGDLAASEVVSFDIVVVPLAEGTITNTAVVSGHELDPMLANNTATLDTTVLPATVYVYLPIAVK